jgi:hypothetical protein
MCPPMGRLRCLKTSAARTALSYEIVDSLGWDRACCPHIRNEDLFVGSG